MPEWKGVANERYDPIQQHVDFVLDNLTPGQYTIDRCTDLGLGQRSGLDRQTIKIESGKTTVTDFVRLKGAPITGQVTGLDQFDLTQAVPPGIYICVQPAEAQSDRPYRDKYLDMFKLLPGDKPVNGRFSTERIPPGRYEVRAYVYPPAEARGSGTVQRGGSRRPAFEGEVLVTVPEEGLPEPVTIPLSKLKASE